MFQVVRVSDNRINVVLSGKLDKEAMKIALDDLVSAAQGFEHGRMLFRIGNFQIPTIGAMAVELSRFPELFRFIRDFDRIAVMADKSWLKKMSEVEGALIPGLEVKGFDPDEEVAAEAWLQ